PTGGQSQSRCHGWRRSPQQSRLGSCSQHHSLHNISKRWRTASASCVRCVWRHSGCAPYVMQFVTKPYQSVGSGCLIERTHLGILPEVLAERCREKLEIPWMPRGDKIAVKDDPAVLPDSAGLHHNRLDGECTVLVDRELAVARKASNPAALDDTGVGCEEHTATDAGYQLVRRRNGLDERLDALVLTQDDRALGSAGNKDAVKV